MRSGQSSSTQTVCYVAVKSYQCAVLLLLIIEFPQGYITTSSQNLIIIVLLIFQVVLLSTIQSYYQENLKSGLVNSQLFSDLSFCIFHQCKLLCLFLKYINRRQLFGQLMGLQIGQQFTFVLGQSVNKYIIMIFQQDTPDDKGLFTFYREEAEKQQLLKLEKKARKKRRELEQLQIMELKQSTKIKKIQPTQHYLLPKTSNSACDRILILRPKLSLPKQRLIESIVDMSKQIQQEQETGLKSSLNQMRLKQPFFVSKARKYREKADELNQSSSDSPNIDLQLLNQMKIQSSFPKRNRSEQLTKQYKQVIHSVRNSVVELPDIKKAEDVKVPYRPKKSIKSKLIQEALQTRDRDKIKQIRSYLKVQPSKRQSSDEESLDEIAHDIDAKSFQVFQYKQEKLLGILKRFKRF